MNVTPGWWTADSIPHAGGKMPHDLWTVDVVPSSCGAWPQHIWNTFLFSWKSSKSVFYTQERWFSLIRFKALETSNNWLKASKLVTCLKSDNVLVMTQYSLMQGKPRSCLEKIAKSRSGNSRVQEKYKQHINKSILFALPQTFTVSWYHRKRF